MNHNRMHMYLLGAAAIVAALVIAKVPLAGILPFGLVLGCGLMMFFMMRGMGGNDDHTGHGGDQDSVPKVDQAPDHEPAEHRL